MCSTGYASCSTFRSGFPLPPGQSHRDVAQSTTARAPTASGSSIQIHLGHERIGDTILALAVPRGDDCVPRPGRMCDPLSFILPDQDLSVLPLTMIGFRRDVARPLGMDPGGSDIGGGSVPLLPTYVANSGVHGAQRAAFPVRSNWSWAGVVAGSEIHHGCSCHLKTSV